MAESLAIIVPAFNEPDITDTLNALYNQNYKTNVRHFVVDNGSTDNTPAILRTFKKDHEDFPLEIMHETEKGTGAASDTGFRHAISQGYQYIARTDADTSPRPDWTGRVVNTFLVSSELHLLGGSLVARRDEHYRIGDSFLINSAAKVARLTLAAKHRDRSFLKAVTGANMATRSTSYETVGGIPRSSIDTQDEDIAYSRSVVAQYGFDAVKLDPKLIVATSMRRIRTYGVLGTARHHLLPQSRAGKNIDVR